MADILSPAYFLNACLEGTNLLLGSVTVYLLSFYGRARSNFTLLSLSLGCPQLTNATCYSGIRNKKYFCKILGKTH